MSSIIKKLVVVALAALGVSCAWVGSRTEPVPPQTWQIPLSVQLSLSKSSKLKAGETINATITPKNRSDQAFELLVVGNFYYITANDILEANAPANSNDLTVKESANTLLVYPPLNVESRAQAIYNIDANGSLSNGGRSVTFSRAGRYLVRGLVRTKVRNVEENSETEVMLYSRETFVIVEE